LSYAELEKAKLNKSDVHQHIITGGYPEIWNENLKPDKWMSSYIQTYVQRDVRLLKNITNLAAFNRFIFLCANYAGQILNRDELAKQTGVDTKTILSWLGLLENSYILYQLQPWHNNLNKRIVKSPKIYFYDTGLLCYLLNIKTATALKSHHAYGAIFENWCITEIRKNNFNNGQIGGMYYFRDSAGNEVDLIEEKNEILHAIEIKAASKITTEMFRGLKYWQKYQPKSNFVLLHGGKNYDTKYDNIHALPWDEVANL
jgi:uncharacterized protein